ncbi:serine/threonine protein kinase [Thermophilibacter provencensis]|uniref:non-specific serine/threonine protein kinase n=1 Tax=Thermophilibacter provencensis TaxID=1852386 RepID=A0ABT7V5J1_9ACTN|nr:serine/threonine-protein kinase [Thermophilibacter provencensis]MDM8271872.1 serine/threonine-protein kinase [Thermophilibacter provencensis]
MNDEQVMHAMGIDDAYHVERVLASGAGGTTELVTLDSSGPFVRKRIPAKLARRGVWATLAECDSARLPRVEATYEMPNEFVVVCDYVPGENLEQLVAARGHLTEKDALQIVTQLCEAVGALHARGIIHRDISPTNVIVAADGAHLIDLGIARFRVEGATRDTTQLGTYGFASPEQYGFAQTDARSDVYSLGRMLGYLLTGVMPAEGDKYEAALDDEALVSPELRAVIKRASAMEPSARYQSAGALAAALGGEKVAAPEGPTGSVEPPTFEPAPRRSGWVKVLLAVMAAVAFVAAVAIILAQTFGSGEKDADSAPLADEPAVSAPVADDEPAGGDGEPAGEAPAAEAADLEIIESGWSVDSQGYVHYALGLRSTGDVEIELPGVTITGRDASGNVIFSEEQYFSAAPSGEIAYFGGQSGNGGTAPATVEFSPIALQDYNIGSEAQSSAFSVSGVSVLPERYGVTNFVGEVTTEKDDGSDVGSQVAVSLVLRDESGAIIYGCITFVSRPAVGESTSFEVSPYGVPEYATYEVHAQGW